VTITVGPATALRLESVAAVGVGLAAGAVEMEVAGVVVVFVVERVEVAA
jgi:hypothetical protein